MWGGFQKDTLKDICTFIIHILCHITLPIFIFVCYTKCRNSFDLRQQFTGMAKSGPAQDYNIEVNNLLIQGWVNII